MASESLTDLAIRQEWMAPIEDGLQKAVSNTFAAGGEAGRNVENALHGTWLGHPLHPVLTDVPIGAWTVAVAMDAVDTLQGNDHCANAADAAVGVGLIGAAGAAITGLTDWHKTDGDARRIGLVHGLLNIGATALFATSWVLRRRKEREAAKVCSLFGYLIAGVSAYLGGSLVYAQRIGVDHAQRKDLPDEFIPVLPEAELQEGNMVRVEVKGTRVLLVRREGRIYALGETCAHMGGPLSEGTLEGMSVRCPWHGSRFALEDGHVLDGPSTYPQPCLEARTRNGQVEVRFSHASLPAGAVDGKTSGALEPAPSATPRDTHGGPRNQGQTQDQKISQDAGESRDHQRRLDGDSTGGDRMGRDRMDQNSMIQNRNQNRTTDRDLQEDPQQGGSATGWDTLVVPVLTSEAETSTMETPNFDMLMTHFGKEAEAQYVGDIWNTDKTIDSLQNWRRFLISHGYSEETLTAHVYGKQTGLYDAAGNPVLLLTHGT